MTDRRNELQGFSDWGIPNAACEDLIFLLAFPNSSHYIFTPIKIVHKRILMKEMFAAWLYFKTLGPLIIIIKKRKLYADLLISALTRDLALCPTFSLTAAAAG